MANMVGANVQELRAAAGRLRSRASSLESLLHEIDGTMRQLSWRGANAERYISTWSSHHRRQMEQSIERLRQGAKDLERNAAEQERISTRSYSNSRSYRSYPYPHSNGSRPPISTQNDFSSDELIQSLFEIAGGALTAQDLIELGEVIGSARNLSEAKDLLNAYAGDAKIGGVGIALDALNIYYHIHEYGINDARTMEAMTFAFGGAVASGVVPFGGLAFMVGTKIGTPIGEMIDQVSNDWYEDMTGASEGWSNSLWLRRNYGVHSFDELSADEASKAVKELNNYREGWSGMWNFVVTDTVENTKFGLKSAGRSVWSWGGNARDKVFGWFD